MGEPVPGYKCCDCGAWYPTKPAACVCGNDGPDQEEACGPPQFGVKGGFAIGGFGDA